MRAALLGSFPRGTPLAVIAPDDSGLGDQLDARRDPAAVFLRLESWTAGTRLPRTFPNVIVEGLDALDDPASLLRDLRNRAGDARLFALIANAASVRALSAFFAGTPLARRHPLVEWEAQRLLADGGWKVLAVKPWPAAETSEARLPLRLAMPSIEFDVSDAQMLERVTPQAFIVIAEAL